MFMLYSKGLAIWVYAGWNPMQLLEAVSGVNFGCQIIVIAIDLVAPKTKSHTTGSPFAKTVATTYTIMSLFPYCWILHPNTPAMYPPLATLPSAIIIHGNVVGKSESIYRFLCICAEYCVMLLVENVLQCWGWVTLFWPIKLLLFLPLSFLSP